MGTSNARLPTLRALRDFLDRTGDLEASGSCPMRASKRARWQRANSACGNATPPGRFASGLRLTISCPASFTLNCSASAVARNDSSTAASGPVGLGSPDKRRQRFLRDTLHVGKAFGAQQIKRFHRTGAQQRRVSYFGMLTMQLFGLIHGLQRVNGVVQTILQMSSPRQQERNAHFWRMRIALCSSASASAIKLTAALGIDCIQRRRRHRERVRVRTAGSARANGIDGSQREHPGVRGHKEARVNIL